MPGGRRTRPQRRVQSLYQRADEQAPGDEEQPTGDDELLVDQSTGQPSTGTGRRTSSRRLQFQETTTTGGGDDEDEDEDQDDEDEGEATPGETASTGSSRPYQRGPSCLPDPRPLPSRRAVIQPVGQR